MRVPGIITQVTNRRDEGVGCEYSTLHEHIANFILKFGTDHFIIQAENEG